MSKGRFLSSSAAFVCKLRQLKILFAIQNLSKTGTYISHSCRWHKFTTKALISITYHFYVFDTYKQLNQSTKRHFCASNFRMVTPTRNSITLYSHYLFLSNFFPNTSQWRHYLREQRNINFSNYFENSAVLHVNLEIYNFITCVNEA